MTSADTATIPRWQIITGWVLSCLILVPFLPSAFMKIAQPGEFLTQWTKTYPAGAARPIGIVEILCVIIYFIPRTRFLGAILLTGYLGGAVATHVQMGQPFIIPIVVGVLAWGGLWGRTARLRDLVPLAKD